MNIQIIYLYNLLDHVCSIMMFVVWGLEVYKTYDVCGLGFEVSVLGYKHKPKLISRKIRLSYD